jgi:MFS family permease
VISGSGSTKIEGKQDHNQFIQRECMATPTADTVQPPDQSAPEVFQTPTQKVPFQFMLRLGLAQVGFSISILPVLTLLIPTQVTTLDRANEASNLALVLTIGATMALIGNPLAGALSDRTTARIGRRRPWLIGGMLLTAMALVILSQAQTVLVVVIGWGLAQLAGNAVYSALIAIVPDRVPVYQRGTVSAVIGMVSPLGTIFGALIVGKLVTDIRIAYFILMGAMLLLTGSFSLWYREPRLPKALQPPFHLGKFMAGFWINPCKMPDFTRAWLARFFMMLSYALGTGGFLFLYLQNIIQYSTIFPGREVKDGIATIQILTTVLLVPSTILFGVLSDRLRRRKIFVITAVSIIAVGLIIIAFFPSWNFVLAGCAAIGIGFGAYMSADVALITQVLPSAASRGKDLGIINIANTLPQSVAPAIGAALINFYGTTSGTGYTTLFCLGALAALGAAALVHSIKSVR